MLATAAYELVASQTWRSNALVSFCCRTNAHTAASPCGKASAEHGKQQ
jgi:hypothetical protein